MGEGIFSIEEWGLMFPCVSVDDAADAARVSTTSSLPEGAIITSQCHALFASSRQITTSQKETEVHDAAHAVSSPLPRDGDHRFGHGGI